MVCGWDRFEEIYGEGWGGERNIGFGIRSIFKVNLFFFLLFGFLGEEGRVLLLFCDCVGRFGRFLESLEI